MVNVNQKKLATKSKEENGEHSISLDLLQP